MNKLDTELDNTEIKIKSMPANKNLKKKKAGLVCKPDITGACYTTVSVLIRFSSRHVHWVTVNYKSRQTVSHKLYYY